MNIFKPYEIIKQFDDLDIHKYLSLGFDTILVDIDNTLAIPDTELIASSRAKAFINNLKNSGFKVIIMSNNVKSRVQPFANSLDCEYLYLCFKPLPFSYFKLIKKYKLDKTKVLTLGDQIITDCIGSNIVGFTPIYTKQLINKDSFKTLLNRFFERLIFRYILHEEM